MEVPELRIAKAVVLQCIAANIGLDAECFHQLMRAAVLGSSYELAYVKPFNICGDPPGVRCGQHQYLYGMYMRCSKRCGEREVHPRLSVKAVCVSTSKGSHYHGILFHNGSFS